jgi:predicted ATP-binding protein involved in virulence
LDFKIIAIKPLPKCNVKIKKVLKTNIPYYLYNNYTIKGDAITEHESHIPADLYNVKKGLQVNISAIVGKNGSGKSTVVELLYAAVYNAACVADILTIDTDGNKTYCDEAIHVAVYYKKGQDYYCLYCRGANVSISRQQKNEKRLSMFQNTEQLKQKSNLKELFYTIAINYSHHSLDASIGGNEWLKHLFHKNDGYQTPVVINPFRVNGDIDMLNERGLILSRIVTNLLTIRENGNIIYNELAPGKKAVEMRFTLNEKKISFDNYPTGVKEELLNKKEQILNTVFKYFPLRNKPTNYEIKDAYLNTAYIYICKKLFSITELYKPYQGQEFRFLEIEKVLRSSKNEPDYDPKYIFDINKLDTLLSKIKSQPSHITFKLRQAINFINNISSYRKHLNKIISIANFATEINNIAKRDEHELITVIPPSFLTTEIRFKSGGWLHSLSSGEKQIIYNATSWIYHLLNLISVREDKKAHYHRYDCINMVFDEIELYYHPEMQRTFIKDFLDLLKQLSLPDTLSFNCIFITHSPFILSDIPNQNILFLTDKGRPSAFAKDKRTFGANIHELLKNNFFLDKGSMGAFAQSNIESVIQFLSKKSKTWNGWDQKKADDFINLISEPVIRNGIRQLYNTKFGRNVSEIHRQIELLKEELKKEK